MLKGQEVVDAVEKGDKIKKVTVFGDTAALFKKEAERLKAWNQILDEKFPSAAGNMG